MRRLVPTTIALVLALGAGFAAAESGEADPAGSRAAPSEKTTKSERVQARKQRHAEVARENKAGELSRGGEASGAPAAEPTQRYSKEERRQARKDRLKESARQNRAGDIPSGER